MERYVIDGLIEKITDCVKKHHLGKAGEYARWLFGENRDLGLNPYGCADAANILYTIGQFSKDFETRRAEVTVLKKLQDPESGLFSEVTHHTLHTTAHCSAAIELYDEKPLYPCYALKKYTTKEGLYRLLENEIDWEQYPWRDSHMGAGILPSLVNSDMVGLEWKDWYFDWMWEHSDRETGFFFCGKERKVPLHEYMAAGFHYMFNHEAEHRPVRYPERIIDSCLTLIKQGLNGNGSKKLAEHCGFIEVDVVYTLTRAMRQTPYRFEEGKQALEHFAEAFLKMMNGIDTETDKYFNDLHALFGSVCCLAELQSALPGKIITTRPLKLVLDRRPFI